MESAPDAGWDADAWDDDDADWGSLEDNKNTTTANQNEAQEIIEEKNVNNEITKAEFDSWANGVLSNKVPDKSVVVKQGIQTLQLVKISFEFPFFKGTRLYLL